MFAKKTKEFVIFLALKISAFSALFITLGVFVTLLIESANFFSHVSLAQFFGDTAWTPLFENPHFGIWPLLLGTFITSAIATVVAVPLGTILAIYVSEFAQHRVRSIVKPALEMLSAVPTVVYGYFALMWITPALRYFVHDLSTFNMLSAGLVMGFMIIPYVSSLSEDALRAVPMLQREGAYALGASKVRTSFLVIVPAAISGISASYILAISRALGETMIVAVAAGLQPQFTFNPLEPAATISSYIVQVSMGDLPHGTVGYQSVFAAGLVLFIFTLFFNAAGTTLRSRYARRR